MQRYRARMRNERGAAAVELALVLIPLLMLMLGIVEFGRIYSFQLRLQQAARETAREVALHYDDPGMTPPALTALANNTLSTLLAAPEISGLETNAVVLCSVPTGDAVVTLIDNDFFLAIPTPSSGLLGGVAVAAEARMPCEG